MTPPPRHVLNPDIRRLAEYWTDGIITDRTYDEVARAYREPLWVPVEGEAA